MYQITLNYPNSDVQVIVTYAKDEFDELYFVSASVELADEQQAELNPRAVVRINGAPFTIARYYQNKIDNMAGELLQDIADGKAEACADERAGR